MKTINELLHRWAGLEPEVCSLDTDSGQAFFWHDGDNSIYIDMLDNPYDRFMLAGFVQQAVESRGWYCVVKTRFTKDEPHWAYVEEMGTVDSNRPHGQCSDDSPAHALLAAYIKALEAVAEVV